jgi:hypothetical protein
MKSENNTKLMVHLMQCARQRCGHVMLEDERTSVPDKLWDGFTVKVCPKCDNESFYTLNTQGCCRTTKDRDLPREINAHDIEPSPRMGMKMKVRILSAKRRAIKSASNSD